MWWTGWNFFSWDSLIQNPCVIALGFRSEYSTLHASPYKFFAWIHNHYRYLLVTLPQISPIHPQSPKEGSIFFIIHRVTTSPKDQKFSWCEIQLLGHSTWPPVPPMTHPPITAARFLPAGRRSAAAATSPYSCRRPRDQRGQRIGHWRSWSWCPSAPGMGIWDVGNYKGCCFCIHAHIYI